MTKWNQDWYKSQSVKKNGKKIIEILVKEYWHR